MSQDNKGGSNKGENEEEFDESEPTPVTAAVRMETGYVKKFRVLRALEERYLRDLYHDAFRDWVERREALGEDPEPIELLSLYSRAPKKSFEGAERMNVSVHESGIEGLIEWAEKDGRPYISAMYSAFHFYLEKRKDELDF